MSMREAANHQDVFLDYVLFEANQNVGHLLDDRYADLLSAEEKKLKKQILGLRAAATPGVRTLPAWRHVAELLKNLGDRPE